jgi:hypothetical protein
LGDGSNLRANAPSILKGSSIVCPSPREPVIRGHDVRLRIDLVRSDSSILFNGPKFSDVKSVDLVNWTKRSARFEGDAFYLTKNCLVFQPREQYGNPYTVFFNVYASCRALVKELEAQNGGLQFSDNYIFVLDQEWAFEKDAFAKACYQLQQKIHNARFHVDFSKGPELEFHHKESGVEDAANYEVLVSAVIDGRIKPGLLSADDLANLQVGLKSLSDMTGSLTENVRRVAASVTLGGLTSDQVTIRLLSEVRSLVAELKEYREGSGCPPAVASPGTTAGAVQVPRSRLVMSSRELYELRNQR